MAHEPGASFQGPLRNKEVSRGNREWFSNLPQSLGADICEYKNDFLATGDYSASDWTITQVEAGAGDASEALAADERCGALVITNDAGASDSDSLQMNEENWLMEAGKRLWFECRFKVSDADKQGIMIGLGITDTTPLATSDAVSFQLATNSAALKFITTKNSSSTTSTSLATLSDDTYVVVGFYWDGKSVVKAFVNRSLVASHTANICDDENLAVTIHSVNGEAVAKVLTIDYIYVAAERP